ncbi:MAG: DUF4369 domain-containing protein [Bacteroidaceae bacterium]|nr:DUF4369 domain-containing protein [Bacteroidaceae bacterium]
MNKFTLLLISFLYSLFSILCFAQTRKPVTAAAKKPATTTVKKPVATTKAAPTKKVTTTNNPKIVKAVQSNPQYKEVSYTLRGKAHGFEEGEWISLCAPGNNGLEATDSVQLQGEDFTFKGRTLNVPYMKYLVVGKGVHKTLVEVFIEEGNITADITADKRIDQVRGTVTNNIYMPYRDSINTIYTQIYDATRESMRMSNSADVREAYKLGIDSLHNQMVQYTYTFARKNINNWAGLYLFAEYHKRFTVAQNKAILAAVPKKYATLPIIAEIRKYNNSRK